MGCVSVLLAGDEPARARSFAIECRIGLAEAHRRVRRMDREQRDFVWQLFSRHLDDPRHYQIVIDSTALGVEQLADLICFAALGRSAGPADLRLGLERTGTNHSVVHKTPISGRVAPS
jgi:Cytidylate kinase-like family